MLATAIIVFREVIEAALIIAIVMGASRGIAGRGRWVGAGIGLGLAGAALVAAFADAITGAFEGNGQALLNAGVLLAAVGMLTWHNVWMSSHGRELAAEVRSVGHAVQTGNKPLTALMVITLVAVMREGSEVVLFLWAIGTGGSDGSMLLGGLAGLAAQTFLQGHGLAGAAHRRGPGSPGGGLPQPGGPPAGARYQPLGQLPPSGPGQHRGQDAAHPHRLHCAPFRHPNLVLLGDRGPHPGAHALGQPAS